MSLSYRHVVSAAMFTFILNPVAMADDEPAIIVTADRFETTIETAPVNITIISDSDVETSTATNLGELLEVEAGIHVQQLYGITGSKSKVDMGGFGGNRTQNTLILLNGRRLNDVDQSGANLASIPIESIERVEVIHGSSTVLYGDNAVSGVINIVTKSGFEKTESQIKAQTGSFNIRQLSASSRQSWDDMALYIAANTIQSDGYRENSGFENSSMFLEASKYSGEWLYGARFNFSQEDIELSGPLNEPDFLEAPTSSTSTTIERANEKKSTYETFIKGEHFAGELAYRDKHQEGKFFGDTFADLATLSITPRSKWQLGGHNITLGVDYYHSTLDTLSVFGSPNNNRNETTRKSYALYATDKYKLSDKDTIQFGARRQKVQLDVINTNVISSTQTSEERSDTLSAWDITYQHQFDNDLRQHVRLARSFRFPVLDEIWSYYSGTISFLKPQKGDHIEIGSSYTTAAGTELRINLFHIELEDEIAYDGSSNTNLDPTRHDGVDLSVRTDITTNWELKFNYAYRDAVFRSGTYNDKTIPEVPEHKLALTNRYNLADNKTISLDAVYTGERYFGNDFANDGKKIPGYTVFDLKYNEKLEDWDISLLVNNLTDKNTADAGYYSIYSSPTPYTYYPLPGRAYYITVNRNF